MYRQDHEEDAGSLIREEQGEEEEEEEEYYEEPMEDRDFQMRREGAKDWPLLGKSYCVFVVVLLGAVLLTWLAFLTLVSFRQRSSPVPLLVEGPFWPGVVGEEAREAQHRRFLTLPAA